MAEPNCGEVPSVSKVKLSNPGGPVRQYPALKRVVKRAPSQLVRRSVMQQLRRGGA